MEENKDLDQLSKEERLELEEQALQALLQYGFTHSPDITNPIPKK